MAPTTRKGSTAVVIASEGVILAHGNFDMTAFVLA